MHDGSDDASSEELEESEAMSSDEEDNAVPKDWTLPDDCRVDSPVTPGVPFHRDFRPLRSLVARFGVFLLHFSVDLADR
jgi:hypothetical protein